MTQPGAALSPVVSSDDAEELCQATPPEAKPQPQAAVTEHKRRQQQQLALPRARPNRSSSPLQSSAPTHRAQRPRKSAPALTLKAAFEALASDEQADTGPQRQASPTTEACDPAQQHTDTDAGSDSPFSPQIQEALQLTRRGAPLPRDDSAPSSVSPTFFLGKTATHTPELTVSSSSSSDGSEANGASLAVEQQQQQQQQQQSTGAEMEDRNAGANKSTDSVSVSSRANTAGGDGDAEDSLKSKQPADRDTHDSKTKAAGEPAQPRQAQQPRQPQHQQEEQQRRRKRGSERRRRQKRGRRRRQHRAADSDTDVFPLSDDDYVPIAVQIQAVEKALELWRELAKQHAQISPSNSDEERWEASDDEEGDVGEEKGAGKQRREQRRKRRSKDQQSGKGAKAGGSGRHHGRASIGSVWSKALLGDGGDGVLGRDPWQTSGLYARHGNAVRATRADGSFVSVSFSTQPPQ